MSDIGASAGGGSISVTTVEPAAPDDASFSIQIDFEKGTGNPQRVFQAADAMIRTFQGLDKMLCETVDSKIEPMMILENIEAGSIKIWLSNQLQRVDDDALKTLEWKPLVGKYLVRAKYVFIKWSNKESESGGLLGLAKELASIAAETDLRHIPDYAVPSIPSLSQAAKDLDSAKSFLLPADKITYLAPGEPPISFNLGVSWSDIELMDLAVKETTSFSKMPMNLIIRKPDYLGKSKWDFRFGKQAISAKIEDQDWLQKFQDRGVDVRPGDALRCLVTIERKYGFDNELIAEDYTITNVEGVLINQMSQASLNLNKPS